LPFSTRREGYRQATPYAHLKTLSNAKFKKNNKKNKRVFVIKIIKNTKNKNLICRFIFRCNIYVQPFPLGMRYIMKHLKTPTRVQYESYRETGKLCTFKQA